MRRLIAYITTAIAMLLAIGVAATPVITKLNAGREFTSSRNYREIVFNIAASKDASDKENEERSSVVAEQMRERLDSYNVEDYSIKIQGEDTVAVALDMDSKEFNYCAKYLTFSGESFALVSTHENETVKNDNKLFNADDIRIEYKGDANIPVIIIPVTDEGKADIKALCNEFSTENGGSDNSKGILRKNPIEVSAEDEEEEEQETAKNYLYLWANYEEGETLDTLNKDPLAREKVLMAFNADSIWYEDSKEAETEIFYMCATAEQDNPNQLDISGLKDDNARANYLVGLLKASAYKFEVSCPTVAISETSMSVDYFANARVLEASAESLLSLGNNVNIKMSKTFIAVAIAIVIISLLLVVYYRLSALAIIASTSGTAFVTLVSFTTMHVLFNIPAVIGFIILTAGAMFGEIFYVNRFKEEVYKGRTIKKANQEASKKSNLVTLDSAIILAFSGLMMYALGGTALKPMGVVLFFGAVFTILMNLLVFKLLMYLVTNSTNLQQKYNVYNIDGEKVPNIMAVEEKPTYEAPYEKVDFTKRKGLISIIFSALSVAALACIIVFGVTSSTKSPLNIEKAVSDTTVIYTSVKSDSEIISDASSFVEYVLKDTDDYIKTKNVEDLVDVKKVSQLVYEDDVQRTDEYYFFTLNLDTKLSDKDLTDLQDKLTNNLDDSGLTVDDLTYAVVRNSQELVYTPNQGYVALATGISIVGVALYFAFRFRPSRALSMLVVTTGATTIAYGAMVAMRFIGTTAITSLAMPVVAITMLLASLFYLTTEKTMLKEGKYELTNEVRKEIMVKSLGKSAAAMFAFMLINLYLIINFFGFGVEDTALLFASAMLGEVVAVIALLTIAGPFAFAIEKLLRKIRLPKIKWFSKDKPKQVTRRNSSEPEETIFIGIND